MNGPETVERLIESIRGATADIVAILPADLSDLDRRLIHAAIAALAIERGPGLRVNAVAPAIDADSRDVEVAADYLRGAGSTTGQIVAVSARTPRVAG